MKQICWIVALASMLGCKPELPPLEYQSERARVGSDVVDRVCGGTLARIDREIEHIERLLNLPRTSSLPAIYIVEQEVVHAHCRVDADACTQIPSGDILIAPAIFDLLIAHELVHHRLGLRDELLDAPRMFREGIAVALEPSYCPRWFSPATKADDLLGARSGAEWLAIPGSYYLGGELFAWLLETHGPAEVLSWMMQSRRSDEPATLRQRYRERFGSEIDDDLFGHRRDPAKINPERLGCIGPRAPADEAGHRFRLQAELDCAAADVHNSFLIDGGGYVEWILAIDEPGRYALIGEIPEWTTLTIEACRCRAIPGEEPQELLARPLAEVETLAAGRYRLRWFGQLDTGARLDVSLVREDG